MTSPRPSAGAASLSLRDLTYSYRKDQPPAGAGIDLDAGAGGMLTLLGPSGCGKTTTLRMIAGLVRPTGGRILVDGADITATPVHRRGMGMVFQDYALFPHLSVGRNVAFGLEMRRVRGADRAERIARALDRVGLGAYAERNVSALSGGQQQRVALARALVVEPRILLLDEPLSNLDATLRASLRDEIRTLQRNSGTTAVFVTHDQQEALAVSDRIVVMNAGRVEQSGSPEEIFDRPATRFVAAFIGQTNVLDGMIAAVHAGTAEVELPGLGVVRGRVDRGDPRVAPGARVSVAVHPHRVRLSEAEDTDPSAGRVTSSVFTGTTVQTNLDIDGHRLRAESLTGHHAATARPGDRVNVTWAPEDAWVITS